MSVETEPSSTPSIKGYTKSKPFRYVNRIACFLASLRKRSKSTDSKKKQNNGSPDKSTSSDSKLPVNGIFTDRQRKIQSINSKALDASLKRSPLFTRMRSEDRPIPAPGPTLTMICSNDPWSKLPRPSRKANKNVRPLSNFSYDYPPSSNSKRSLTTSSAVRTLRSTQIGPSSTATCRPLSDYLNKTYTPSSVTAPHLVNFAMVARPTRMPRTLCLPRTTCCTLRSVSTARDCASNVQSFPVKLNPGKSGNICKVTTCHRSPRLFPSRNEAGIGARSHSSSRPVIYPPRLERLSAHQLQSASPPTSTNERVPLRELAAASSNNNNSNTACPTVGSPVMSPKHTTTHRLSCAGYSPLLSMEPCVNQRDVVRTFTFDVPRKASPEQSPKCHHSTVLETLIHNRSSWTPAMQTVSKDALVTLPHGPVQRPFSTIISVSSSVGTEEELNDTSDTYYVLSVKTPKSTCACLSSSPVLMNSKVQLLSAPILRPPMPPSRTTSLVRESSRDLNTGPTSSKAEVSDSTRSAPSTADYAALENGSEPNALKQNPTWWLNLLPYKPSNLPTNLADRLRHRNSLMLSQSSPNSRLSNSSLPNGLINFPRAANGNLPKHFMTQSLYEQRSVSFEDHDDDGHQESPRKRVRNESCPRPVHVRVSATRPSSLYTVKPIEDALMHLPSLDHLASSRTLNFERGADKPKGTRPSVLSIRSQTSETKLATPSPITQCRKLDASHQTMLSTLKVTNDIPSQPTKQAIDSPLLSPYCHLLIMRTIVPTHATTSATLEHRATMIAPNST